MRSRLISRSGVAAVALASAILLLKLAAVPAARQSPAPAAKSAVVSQVAQAQTEPAKAAPAPKTPWGEPDLQGIWTDEYQTPLQRQTRYANKEFFTEQERADIDNKRASLLRRDVRAERGSEHDVAGAYNTVFTSIRHTGRRTSMVVDPPDGRIPPLTAEAQQRAKIDQEFRLALLQATATCKDQEAGCAGGKYGPRSSRYSEIPPVYNTGRLNRHDGPEDGSLFDRCMGAGLPDFGGFRRIVQTPGGITMFYDVGQGQGWQRTIVMNGTPHIPSQIRQSWGDSRGHWEGNTLVIDVTNFSPKTSFPLGIGGAGSTDNLHLLERWTRLDANTLEYAVTISDPTVWTKPWTVKQEMTRQSEQSNRVYYEPRCHEGNYGLPALLQGTRVEEVAFAEGRGPDPASRDTATCYAGDSGDDPLVAN
jgi:hypothetical protein